MSMNGSRKTMPGATSTSVGLILHLHVKAPYGEFDAPVAVDTGGDPITKWTPDGAMHYVYALPGGQKASDLDIQIAGWGTGR